MLTKMTTLLFHIWIATSYCFINAVAGLRGCTNMVKPVFVPTDIELRADELSSLTLPCVYNNMTDDFRIYWYAGSNNLFWNGVRQQNVDNYRLAYSPDNPTRSSNLTIKVLSSSDSLTYKCRASAPSADCRTQAEFKVIVNYRPRVQFIELREPPYWNDNNRDRIFVNETDNITLGCNTLSEPAPLVSWKMITPDGKEIELSPGTEDTNLTISNVSRRQGGIYHCQSTNRLGFDTGEIELVVQYAPEVIGLQSDIRAAAGSSVIFGCDVTAKPERISFYWMKDGVRLKADDQDPTSKTYVILKLDPETDYGNYTCVATNQVGTASATIEVNGRPRAPLILNKDPQGSYRNSYNLTWSPSSSRQENIPIARYVIKYQRKYIQNINGRMKLILWPNEALSETVHGGQLSIRLRDLKENSSYVVRVCPESDYGMGDCVSYTFTTSLVDRQPPPPSPEMGYLENCPNPGGCVGTWTPPTGSVESQHSMVAIVTLTLGFIPWLLTS